MSGGGVGRMSLAPIEPGTTNNPTGRITLAPNIEPGTTITTNTTSNPTNSFLQPKPLPITVPTTLTVPQTLTTGTRTNPLPPMTTSTNPTAGTSWTTVPNPAPPLWSTTPNNSLSSNIMVPQTQTLTTQPWNTGRPLMTLPQIGASNNLYGLPHSTAANPTNLYGVPNTAGAATNLYGVPNYSGTSTGTAANFLDSSTAGGHNWQTAALPQKLGMGPRLLALSDENIMVKEVEETHSMDNVAIDVRPLLEIVEDIFNFSQLSNPVQGNQLVTKLEDRRANIFPDELSHYIERISCEIQQIQCGKGADGHGAAIPLFKLLSMYRWDAKLVLTLAAFALSYGEFWLLAQTYLSNPLAKSMAILKRVPVLIERSSGPGPKHRYDAIGRVIKAMLEVTRLIVEFYELSMMHISSDLPSKVAPVLNIIPTAAYQSVRGVITCVSQIINLSSSHDYGYSSSMGWDPLQNVAQSLESILAYLQREMDVLRRTISERWEDQTFETLLHIVYEMVHVDNMRVLSALIPAKDPEPLLNCATMRPASLEYLKHKNVLLLISDLDMLVDELLVLEQIYHDSKQHDYEVVWIPVVDPSLQSNEVTMSKFNKLQSTMQWYSLRHPSMIDRPVKRFLKEVWGFHAKPIMVVLDTRGKVLSTNAILMMLIWGSTAFPFTSHKERELWLRETWKLELLVDGIEPTVLEWIRDKKYIFLYGGEDIKLIRDFTTEAKKVSAAAGINLEMVYVGNSHGREKIKNIMNIINREKLSHCWTEPMVWFFWTRLESMLLSRFQIDMENTGTLQTRYAKHFPGARVELAHADKDLTVQEIKKLMSFGRGGGWAVFAQGSQVLPPTHLITVVHVLLRFKEWEMDVVSKGSFLTAFWDQLKAHHDELKSCIRVEFRTIYGMLPEGIECPECHRFMEKHNSFVCCHDDPAALSLMDHQNL